MVEKLSNLIVVQVKAMCGEFGEVTVIIGLEINLLAFVSPLFACRDTSTYATKSLVWVKKTNVFTCNQAENCLYLNLG